MSATDKALATFAAILVGMVLLTVGIVVLVATVSGPPIPAVPVAVYTCTGKCELVV